MNNSEIENLALIPARGGSKGIIRKNLQEIAGVSLVGHAIRFAQQSGLFDAIHLSTDDDEIAREGGRYGCSPTFMRSAQTSGDRASATDVVREVRRCFLEIGTTVRRYVLIEPTSPMREARFVSQAIELTKQHFDAALTVSQVDIKFHPDKQFEVSEQGAASLMTDNGRRVVARQELSPTFVRNGFCYVVTDRAIAEGHSILGARLGAVICDVPYVNIDSLEELALCRQLMEHGTDQAPS